MLFELLMVVVLILLGCGLGGSIVYQANAGGIRMFGWKDQEIAELRAENEKLRELANAYTRTYMEKDFVEETRDRWKQRADHWKERCEMFAEEVASLRAEIAKLKPLKKFTVIRANGQRETVVAHEGYFEGETAYFKTGGEMSASFFRVEAVIREE